jgi:hypothetical protein
MILLFSISGYAQSIEVFADTDTTEYIVGDFIEYTLEMKYSKDIRVELPSVIDSISVLEFIKEEQAIEQIIEGENYSLRTFIFSRYDSADVTISAFNINYYVGNETEASVIRVNPVNILVRTIEVDASSDIQDVKAPIKIQLDWLLIALIILAILILALGGYYGYKHYQSKKTGVVKEKKIIKIPAYKIALEALDDLDYKKLWQQGHVKEYHSEITGIIRRYFEERFNFLAMEMTSSEIMNNLSDSVEAKEIMDETKEFLSNADMVKFAKFKPIPSVNEEMLKQAYDIVNKTKVEEEIKVETVEVENV